MIYLLPRANGGIGCYQTVIRPVPLLLAGVSVQTDSGEASS